MAIHAFLTSLNKPLKGTVLSKKNGSLKPVIHLAGKAHDTKNTAEEQTYFDINVGLTQKIFEFYLQSNASKFIFFSSVKAVAEKYLLKNNKQRTEWKY